MPKPSQADQERQVREALPSVVEAINHKYGGGTAELVFANGKIAGIKINRKKERGL